MEEQTRSFYALEQLRKTAKAIMVGCNVFVKTRARVEKYRTAQPERAYMPFIWTCRIRAKSFFPLWKMEGSISWNWKRQRLPKKLRSFMQDFLTLISCQWHISPFMKH